MDCIESRIGILGCGVPSDADNQLFINQLPGVTIKKMESLADGDEQQSFIDVWSDISLRANKKFAVLVKSKINECHRITDKTIIECLVCEKVDLFDVALWYLYGTELMIEITSSDALNRYTTIDLDKAESLKEEFYTEFLAALNDAVLSIDPNDTECVTGCVPCNDRIRFVEQVP